MSALASVSTVEQALSFIPADDRETWIDCGMAIKAELGDVGFDAWDRWSATTDNYQARAAAASWKSFKASGGVNIGTLFHHAKQHGYQHNTTSKPTPPTPEEIAQREAKRKAEADLLASRREAASDKAASIWNAPASALEATQPAIADHGYLKHKRIQPHGAKIYHGSLSIGGMACNGALMIPMKLNGKITSLQFINSEGEKRFLPSGEKGGYMIGKITPDAPICIAEGFATGASIHEATGHAVVVAFDAGNLRKMAELLREKNPDAVIVLCADDDETGTGQRKATEAAQAVGGLLAMPVFGEQRLPGVKDFNDMATLTGLEAVKLAIDTAKPVEQKSDPVGLHTADSNSGGDAKVLPRGFAPLPVVQITCAADIQPEAIRWLWVGYLARGKFHVFAGMAGDGKTTIAIALAATVSNGGRFPDGTRAPVGNVLIWSGEDSAKDTLVPRLIAAGADMSKVHFIGDVKHGDEIRSFDPATDIKAMADAATRIGNISLLVVDPVVNAVAGDSHKNGEVRRALQPLVELAEKLGCAVLGITHFSKGTGGKNPLERVTGSLAFGALARVVLATGKIDEGGTIKRIFCRAKSNIGPDDGGFEYDFVQEELKNHPGIIASSIMWGNAVEGSARELLAEPDYRESGEHDTSALDDAKEFLQELLADGELPQKQIQADAKGASHSWSTVRRAKSELFIKSVKSIDGWYWKLPVNMPKTTQDAQGAHINNVSALSALTESEQVDEVVGVL